MKHEIKRARDVDYLECGLVEVKFAEGDGAKAMSFSGYGAVFGNVDSYGDVIEPGAFANYLAEAQAGKQAWPAMLLQHGGFGLTAEDMTPIGVWTDLSEDGKGLKVAGQFADTPRGREVHALMKMAPRPAMDGLSIGYIAKESEPRSKPEDPRRRIKRIDLVEISPVTFPANRKARTESVKHGLTTRSAEQALCDAGFSRREAKAIVAGGFRALSANPRDAGGELGEIAALLKRTTTLPF
jgi:HK97 family phage prohead protease